MQGEGFLKRRGVRLGLSAVHRILHRSGLNRPPLDRGGELGHAEA
ncbi:MAG: hypothetical protein QW587_03865 [Candidatus Bathyarchaeia archaeon]